MIGKQNEFPNVLDEEGSNIENDLNEFAVWGRKNIYISIVLFFRLQFVFECYQLFFPGADPGFFVGWGAPPQLPFDLNFNHFYGVKHKFFNHVSCFTSTPINHWFFLLNTSCIRKPQVILEGGGGISSTP